VLSRNRQRVGFDKLFMSIPNLHRYQPRRATYLMLLKYLKRLQTDRRGVFRYVTTDETRNYSKADNLLHGYACRFVATGHPFDTCR
jgi:hypothetical protein